MRGARRLLRMLAVVTVVWWFRRSRLATLVALFGGAYLRRRGPAAQPRPRASGSYRPVTAGGTWRWQPDPPFGAASYRAERGGGRLAGREVVRWW